MIKKIRINNYRRLKDIEFELSPNITAISGVNGSCKTSLLHIISNSFKSMTKSNTLLKDKNLVPIINHLNHSVNPKIESLTKGDKIYNDPAPMYKGVLYEIDYLNNFSLKFRRHNSKKNVRYSVKPKYSQKGESLPVCPVIYLSMGRLFNFGEYLDDDNLKKIRASLPKEYEARLNKNYYNLTGLEIHDVSQFKMGNIKTRPSFTTNDDGVDSNTISSGEDNVYIILSALESLRFYYENITSVNEIESILLIDEFDATLHPGLQNDLYDLIAKYSVNYKIQVVFTTHSFSLIEYILKRKKALIYLINQGTRVKLLEDNNIYTIKKILNHETKISKQIINKIPIFMEDDEARFFLNMILDYLVNDKKSESIRNIRSYLHLIETKMSSENLKGIFNDKYLLDSTLKSICILDGDRSSQKNLSNHIITLPGNNSPEKVLCEYLEKLFKEDSEILYENQFFNLGFTRPMINKEILTKINEFEKNQNEKSKNNKSIKGDSRAFYKKLFNDNIPLFTVLCKEWIKNNDEKIKSFYDDFKIMFLKCAEFHRIDKSLWIEEKYKVGDFN
ncbi:AAA family ATPase [Staphylococcus saprophyticus]|uniref:AAA family ATPase n=1 Tax=Staphylococcus saprophyticus TaxID=29385 RepID=UPI00297B4660|nr:AAA family ATPase [Staphylococcus saprophyticus]